MTQPFVLTSPLAGRPDGDLADADQPDTAGPRPAPQAPPDAPQDASSDMAPATRPVSPVTLRRACPLDAGKLGAILTEAAQANTWQPRLHTGAEDIAFVGQMIDNGWVTVAEIDGRVAGFLARDGDAIHSLYVAGFAQGRGLGRALLDQAKAARDRLDLWTFQRNHGARRFYQREGFVPAGQTDGADNEEGLPDIRFVWTRG